MDQRDWRTRDRAGYDQYGGESPGRSLPASGSSGATATLTPLIPTFRWSAQYPDFPMPFPGYNRTPALAAATAERPGTTFDEVLAPSTAWLKPAAGVLVALIVVMLAAWQFLGNDKASQGTSTATTESLGGSLIATQRPGEGGAATTPSVATSPTARSTATRSPETAGNESTSTSVATTPEIINPADLAIVQVDSLEGENLEDVAARWGLNTSTLVWANENIGDPGQVLDTGTAIVIPPVDGVVYTVQAGDTLESITARYGLDASAITSVIQNGVTADSDLTPGMQITIFGAKPISRSNVATYTVQAGDDLWKIAGFYGLDPATIAVANDLPADYLIYPDQKLVIPPADGILYTVQEGDSVETIAAAYNVSADVIRAFPFNNLGNGQVLHPGQQILIPTMDLSNANGGKGGNSTAPAEDPFAVAKNDTGPKESTGTFVWPAAGSISRPFGGAHTGIDIANATWTPIVAADGGVVTFAGWNEYGLGYAVAIDHENGYVSWYGHMAEPPAVKVGDRVAQGDWLGPMGSTGKSTGPHLHFVILHNGIYENPATYLP